MYFWTRFVQARSFFIPVRVFIALNEPKAGKTQIWFNKFTQELLKMLYYLLPSYLFLRWLNSSSNIGNRPLSWGFRTHFVTEYAVYLIGTLQIQHCQTCPTIDRSTNRWLHGRPSSGNSSSTPRSTVTTINNYWRTTQSVAISTTEMKFQLLLICTIMETIPLSRKLCGLSMDI